MANEVRDRTGPLTKLQRSMLLGVLAGKSHVEIGWEHGKSPTHTSNILSAATAKMGCRKTAQAAGHYATHLAYLEAAELLESGVYPTPVNAAEFKVNEVLTGMAEILKERAGKLLPA